jgi:hypothetical protein
MVDFYTFCANQHDGDKSNLVHVLLRLCKSCNILKCTSKIIVGTTSFKGGMRFCDKVFWTDALLILLDISLSFL